MIASDFVGVGLPDYLWFQLTNLLYKVDQAVADDLVCEAAVGGTCRLSQTCATYTNLWTQNWSFKVKFASSTNYLVFPIAALAADNAQNQCQLYIQYFNENQYTQSSNIVLGSMFLQQYAVKTTYDLAAFTTTISMYISDTCTLNTNYVGLAAYTNQADPFTLLHGTTQTVFINTDQFYYQTTIGAQLGFQGSVQFKVSLLGQYVFAWDSQCLLKGGSSMWTSCENSPQYSLNYFDQSVYNSTNNYTD